LTEEGSENAEIGNPKSETASQPVAIFSNMVSPADLRHIRDLCAEWETGVTLVPDYSETLDGPSWADFERTPVGGTTVAELRALGTATAAIELGHVLARAEHTAGTHVKSKFHVPLHRIGLPIGVRACDEFSAAMEAATGREMPRRTALDRGRLVDSYVDAHKYLSGKKAVVYGEEDLVAGLAVFLAETGITPVLCASGGRTKRLAEAIFSAAPELRGRAEVREGSDFGEIEARAAELKPDLLIGSSKGYRLARSLGVPLVRCGFPVHDRIGAQRIRILGYAGTQELFDRIVNAVLEAKQEDSEIGYAYL
jgi:nitrogenase molybdenum-iron protein NifN